MALPKVVTGSELERLRAAYEFADEREVTAFLEEHPQLIPILEQARERLAARFGSDTPVRLEVVLDPENEVDRTLVARAETGQLPAREALDRLWAFYDDWGGPIPASPTLLRFDVE